MKKILFFFRSFFVVLLSLTILLIFIFLWSFQNSKPKISGQVEVRGLSGKVQIVRDAYGVPHIFGQTDQDVYFGLGYAQAQDRFFQMDLTRRLMYGRLSELVGSLTLKLDAQNRIRGFSHVIEAITQKIDPKVLVSLQAFTDGVNARLVQGAVSAEYALLMATPERWRVQDVVAVSVAMADNLVAGYERELARSQLAEKLSAEQINEFYPVYPDWASRSIAQQGAEIADSPLNGSNAWWVSGALTTSGKALLANDPHLLLTSPGSFYLAHLALSDGDVVGAVLPGEPFVVIGRNEKLAWTNTTNPVDAEDLIPEPQGGFENLTESTEVIRVRKLLFFEDVAIQVKRSPLGPVLDPAWFDLDSFKTPVVLRSAALDASNGIVNSVNDIAKTSNAAEFANALEAWHAPMTNILVATTDGEHALFSTGRLPLRKTDGSWSESIPWKSQPNFINPVADFITTANNFITPPSYAYLLPGTYSVYRQARIQEALKQQLKNGKTDAAKMLALQTDVTSVFAERILAVLLQNTKPATSEAQQALSQLQSWSGAMSANSREPLIFAAWMKNLTRAIYADEFGEKLFESFQGPRPDFIDRVLNGVSSAWCDIQGTEKIESCADLMGPSLDQAMIDLAKAYGSDQTQWQWGEAHQAVFKHSLLSGVPLFDKIFTVREPIGGDADTVFAAAYSFSKGYSAVHGPGMRVVYDLGDLQKTRFMLAPGQSGHPWSPHFKDLAPLWAQGQSFEVRTDWTPENAPAGSHALILSPAL